MFKNRKLEIKLVKDEAAATGTPVAPDLDVEKLARAIIKNLVIATVVTTAVVVVVNVLGEVVIKAIESK
jgi:hypothetical protein